MNKPRLRRDIQPVPISMGSRQMITFVDPMQLSEKSPAIGRDAVFILQMLDGNHDMRDIQMEMVRRSGGSLVSIETIESFIEQLDQAFLLESERFIEKKRAFVEEFEGNPKRRPWHADKSYEADPERLRACIEETEADLPGLDPDSCSSAVAGILAPHIDITVARTEYVDVYRRLKGRHYDLVVILGINHQGMDGLYCVSDKTFITPFGEMASETDFVRELKRRVVHGTIASSDFDHKTEHSIEFQTIFLKYYLEGETAIVPVLCNSVHEFVLGKKGIFEDERYTSMVKALQELISECSGDVLIVAGVDFSHIGPKFGHSMPAGNLLASAQSNDETIISYLKDSDPERIFAHCLETRDQYNVCGLPSLLVFSALMNGCRAELLAHKAYDEKATRSAVTYASMMYTRP